MVAELVAALTLLGSAASLYFQADDPARKQGQACRSLAELLNALDTIAYTGGRIGAALEGGTRIGGAGGRDVTMLDELIELLSIQNGNLRRATIAFGNVAGVLNVHPPVLAELHFHLRGKNSRIDILQNQAEIERVRTDSNTVVEDWEVSKLGAGVSSLREFFAEAIAANPNYGIEVGMNLRSRDHDYERIVEAIEPLRQLIRAECRPGDLS